MESSKIVKSEIQSERENRGKREKELEGERWGKRKRE